MAISRGLIILLYTTLCTLLPARQGERPPLAQPQVQAPSPVRFAENKGQWQDHILFAADIQPGGRVFIERNQLAFAFCDTRDLHEKWFHSDNSRAPFTMDCHAYALKFVGGNPNPVMVPEDIAPDYNNYFVGQDSSKWASEVRLFGKVRIKDIYPGIDYIIQGEGTSLKYSFEVAPGADPGQIRMQFDGQDDLTVQQRNLLIKTSLFTITDMAPVAFQGGTEPISCDFVQKGKTVSFALPEGYDPTRPLLIDPTMVFSTYTGSTADNFGFTATYDNSKSLYAGGIAYGQGYPVTFGAFQTNFNGGSFDVSISKFAPNGAHLFSTYIGGGGADQPHSMVVDSNNTLFIMGRTNSNNFPVIGGCVDLTYNGNADIFVCRLNSSGTTMMGSTFMGGSGDDALNVTTNYQQNGLKHNYGDDARGEIVIDQAGNVYVANCTQSTNFPTTPGALRTTLGGIQDGCVFKMNPTLTNLVYSTYLGGSASDAAYSLKVDGLMNAVVTGGTSSSNFPIGAGGYSSSYNGGIDGFIVRINDSGTGVLTGTFIGNASYNQCYFVEMDDDEDIYVVGQKIGAWPVTPGVWSSPQGGQFIMKLNSTLSNLIYSTQFGTSNSNINISPTAFLVDYCEYVYVSGWGGNTNFEGSTYGLPVTGDAFQSSTTGSDLYIIVFEKDAVTIDYGTFIGGPSSNEHVDGGTSRFNKDAEIYQSVCAGCWSNSDFPTTSNAWSNTNNSSGCNLACFKMELELPGVRSYFSASPSVSGCAPLNVQFTNNSVGAVSYSWNFGDPISGALNSSTLFTPTHLYTQPGVYQVMLIAYDPNSCNLADTSYSTITVFPPAQGFASPDTTVCLGESVPISASGGQLYNWAPSIGLSGTHGSTVSASPTTTTTYTVEVIMASGCRDTVSVTVEVLIPPTAVASPDSLICPGDSIQLTASGGVTYAWSNTSTLSSPNSNLTWAYPATTTNYVVTVTGANGCTDSENVQISVSTVQAQAGPDIDLCMGSSVTLNASGGGTYSWTPVNFLSAPNSANPVANPNIDMTYYLVVTDAYGCQDLDSLQITMRPLPVVDAGPDQILCELDSIPLAGSGANTYTWAPGGSLTNPNIANPIAFPSVTTAYQLTGLNQWGCQDRDSVVVQVLPAPSAVANGPSIICEDSTAQLIGSGGMSYEWVPGALVDNPFIANPIATLDSTTEFILRVIAANGCDNFDTLRISVTPTPVADLGPDRTVCLGHTTNLYAFGGQSVLWNTGHTTPRVVVAPDSSTYYSAVVFVDGCPSRPDSILITIDTLLPVANFLASPDSGLVPMTTTFDNQSTGAVAYAWQFDDGFYSQAFEPTHVYQDTGTFYAKLIAFSATGCSDTMVQRLIVGVDFKIYVPNAFTPNGDGINDYFNTPWIGVKDFHVMIFDRWGMLIYESQDPDFRWYGDLHGDPCQEGVYTYVVEASGYLNKPVKRAGTVTLYR